MRSKPRVPTDRRNEAKRRSVAAVVAEKGRGAGVATGRRAMTRRGAAAVSERRAAAGSADAAAPRAESAEGATETTTSPLSAAGPAARVPSGKTRVPSGSPLTT